jgi:hypothetical protein
MSRKKGPALYELISSNKPAGKPVSPKSPVDRSEEEILAHNVLTPGRSVRVSIGTIGVVIAISIALIVISYTMGFRRGSAIAREDYGSRLFEEVVNPQLAEVNSNNSVAVESVTTTHRPMVQPALSAWGPITSDPRAKGLNYFTLIQTTQVGAMQLAVFCREKGLETYAFSGNNTRLYRVIAFPGSVDPNDAVASEVRSSIYAIGAEWANTKDGRGSDLKDAYQSLYK